MNCCSFGYCSSYNVCQGRKVEGDNCENDLECTSSICSIDLTTSANHSIGVLTENGAIEYQNLEFNIGTCMEKPSALVNYTTIMSIIIVIFAIILIAVSTFCLCNQSIRAPEPNRNSSHPPRRAHQGSNQVTEERRSTRSKQRRPRSRQSSNYSNSDSEEETQ
jgi:hypothetical protein